MTSKNIYEIVNTEYKFDPEVFTATRGYMLVTKQDDVAELHIFGESIKTHSGAIEWYKERDISVEKAYVNGEILNLVMLKHEFNKKPYDDVVASLDKILLK